MRTACRSLALCCFGMVGTAVTVLPAQDPVGGMTTGSNVVQRAQAFIARGQHDSATLLLDRHLTREQNDGRAWFYLGRIYLDDAQRWHRAGHPPGVSSGLLLDFASTSLERAQELLTDSGGVFRVIVAIERTTLWIENHGWDTVRTRALAAEELPLPPVLAELGRNLIASCPKNGVFVTGSLTESAAVWGVRLQRGRSDLILVRPDLYQADARYRDRMAAAIGADVTADFPAALAAASRTHPVCLGPSVEPISGAGLEWYANRLVIATTPPAPALSSQVSMFQFARTGLAGSVWTVAAREVYDLAARRNHALCSTLFTNTEALTLPAIPACTP